VPFDAPEERHFAAFRDAMAGADDAPVHVHCILNWRVSAFLYRYNRDVAGMAEADAQAIMRHQWWPPESDHKDAPAWATFIGRPFPA
jgi:predicted RNA polymerase sigma factor